MNCPRRTITIFKHIKKKLNNFSEPLILRYTGSNWGMCSNSIHFVDLFFYFVNYKENYRIKTNLKIKFLQEKELVILNLKAK